MFASAIRFGVDWKGGTRSAQIMQASADLVPYPLKVGGSGDIISDQAPTVWADLAPDPFRF